MQVKCFWFIQKNRSSCKLSWYSAYRQLNKGWKYRGCSYTAFFLPLLLEVLAFFPFPLQKDPTKNRPLGHGQRCMCNAWSAAAPLKCYKYVALRGVDRYAEPPSLFPWVECCSAARKVFSSMLYHWGGIGGFTPLFPPTPTSWWAVMVSWVLQRTADCHCAVPPGICSATHAASIHSLSLLQFRH